MSRVKDSALAPQGQMKIEWARSHMPVLAKIRSRLEEELPFKNLAIGMCMHLEMKTAVLGQTLQAGGATIAITGSNPLSTQDDVAAALALSGPNVYAWKGVTEVEHQKNLSSVLSHKPEILIDDGGELSVTVHTTMTDLKSKIIGACEETTTGVHRYRAMEKDGILAYPVVAVNDAFTKYLFDSQHGTGQSALEGIMRATNMLIAGRTIVICGFGWVGRGIALRAKGLGAKVVVTEVDPVRALEAAMEGYEIMTMSEAAEVGEIFVTATGCKDIIVQKHFEKMKDGAILANSGHYDVEIDVKSLRTMARSTKLVRQNVQEFTLGNGRHIHLLAEGRLVNLAAADGHPAEVMDMSFANQALAAEYLLRNKGRLERKVYRMPEEIDREVASVWLESHNIAIDSLNDDQRRYIGSWR